ncbi:hypothetical protein [Mastigocoleus testarum]|uniref:Uncharacterized protein n=1 Tax=Mastigocoleus testarum BC008 TaxID=371196 RepID=A0A0V7ZCL7_9CYAN|nr:hypothetical protein [Mastigocoleus testarum]KST62247.1 hypothetical protein BC008_08750 [Mastigocoleus testarum BC008]
MTINNPNRKKINKHISRVSKWLTIVAVVITLVQTIVLPANAVTIAPGKEIVGPASCPQIEISTTAGGDTKVSTTAGYDKDMTGVYAITLTNSPTPLTNRNFVPSDRGAIDSYFPPGAQQVKVKNIGEVEIDLGFVCD